MGGGGRQRRGRGGPTEKGAGRGADREGGGGGGGGGLLPHTPKKQKSGFGFAATFSADSSLTRFCVVYFLCDGLKKKVFCFSLF